MRGHTDRRGVLLVEEADEELVVSAGDRYMTDPGFVPLGRLDNEVTERRVIVIRRETSERDDGA